MEGKLSKDITSSSLNLECLKKEVDNAETDSHFRKLFESLAQAESTA